MWCDISFLEPTKDSQVKTYKEVEQPMHRVQPTI